MTFRERTGEEGWDVCVRGRGTLRIRVWKAKSSKLQQLLMDESLTRSHIIYSMDVKNFAVRFLFKIFFKYFSISSPFLNEVMVLKKAAFFLLEL